MVQAELSFGAKRYLRYFLFTLRIKQKRVLSSSSPAATAAAHFVDSQVGTDPIVRPLMVLLKFSLSLSLSGTNHTNCTSLSLFLSIIQIGTHWHIQTKKHFSQPKVLLSPSWFGLIIRRNCGIASSCCCCLNLLLNFYFKNLITTTTAIDIAFFSNMGRARPFYFHPFSLLWQI